jgi:hypothetical protein
MTLTEAKKIGSQQGLISVGLGLLSAQLIMTLLIAPTEGIIESFTWLTDINYLINIIIGALAMFLSGHLYGQLAGKEIIIKKRDHTWVGFKYGMLTLWTGTFVGSLIGFFDEGFYKIGMHDDPFFDYLFKPLFWVTLFGLIPVLVVGFWFGRQIKKKIKEKIKHGTQHGI